MKTIGSCRVASATTRHTAGTDVGETGRQHNTLELQGTISPAVAPHEPGTVCACGREPEATSQALNESIRHWIFEKHFSNDVTSLSLVQGIHFIIPMIKPDAET